MTGRVVIVGDVIDDVIVTPSGAVRRGTDTTSDIRVEPGGSAANTAAWLARLGVAVDFHGLVGVGDAERHALALQRHGVRAYLAEHPDLPTGRIVVIVEGEERTFLTMGGANRMLSTAAVTDAALAGAAAVHLTGHSMMEPARLADAADLVARASRLGVPVVVDPSSAGYLTDLGPGAFLAAMRGVDALLPNLDEGRVLTGLDDPPAIAVALTEVAASVALTLGPAGAIVAVRGESPVHVPAVPAERVDPTGAGDAFAAGFHAARVRGADPVAAAREAVAIAARAVSRPGARPS